MPAKLKLTSLPQKPAAFLEPMECLAVSKLPDSSNWIWEVKIDGYRAIAGDDGFRNFSELILELQAGNLPATKINIDSAIMSIQHATEGGGTVGKFSTRRRRPLIYVQRQQERPKSFHQQTDDGTNPFSTSGMVRQGDGSFRSKTPQEQRRDAELASERLKAASTRPSKHVDAWQTIAKTYIGPGGSHGRNAALQEIYDRGENGLLEWREVARQMG